MKKSEIERLLKNASEGFTPDVFPQIIRKRHDPVDGENTFYKRKNIVGFQKKKLVVALACLIIISLSIGAFFGIMNQENEVVYLEINPSLEIITNRFERIKEVRYLNEDAKTLFEGYELKNMKVEKALNLFIDLSYDKGYIEENDQINIFVEAKDEKKAQNTVKKLQSNARKKVLEKSIEPNINASRVTKEEVKRAKKNGIPVEKIVAIRQIIAIDDSLNKEELSEKSIKELRAILKEYRTSQKPDEDENPGRGDPGQDNPGQGSENDNPGQDNPGQGGENDNSGQDNPGQGGGNDNPGQDN
ncbi:MAG: anti-sigma-I factor RsgI family protein, partial [Bacillota bacterium]